MKQYRAFVPANEHDSWSQSHYTDTYPSREALETVLDQYRRLYRHNIRVEERTVTLQEGGTLYSHWREVADPLSDDPEQAEKRFRVREAEAALARARRDVMDLEKRVQRLKSGLPG
jgi:hypothetical protein